MNCDSRTLTMIDLVRFWCVKRTLTVVSSGQSEHSFLSPNLHLTVVSSCHNVVYNNTKVSHCISLVSPFHPRRSSVGRSTDFFILDCEPSLWRFGIIIDLEEVKTF